MKVLGRDKLSGFVARYANTRQALATWLAVIERSDWQTPQDIKARYPSADFLANNRIIFNIKGNHYRLVAQMSYKTKTVMVLWIGTHAQYDKQTF